MVEICNAVKLWCYQCPHRYCQNEDAKYKKLKLRAEDNLVEEIPLHFVEIDFENNDKVANGAFERFRKWLEAEGYVGGEPRYKEWILYRSDKPTEPVTECGYHGGTFYFHKFKKG